MANNNKLHTSKVTAVMPQLRSPQSVDMSIFNQQMSKMRSMSANNGISKAAQNVLNDMESRRKQSSQNVRSMIQSAQKERAAEAARRQKTEANLEPYRQLSEENAQKVYRKLFTTDELNGTATVGIKDVNNLTDDDFQLLKGRAQQRLTVNTRKGEEKQNELENNILRDFISQIPDNGNVQTPTQGSARYVKQDEPTDVFNMPSNEPVSDDTEFSIPINKDRNISVKYRTVKAIDDYVNSNQKQNNHKTAQGIDNIINDLGLDGKELDDAKSYAGLKKLSLFDNNSSKNVGKLGRAERIITYLPAKAYKGVRDFTYSAKNFMANLGGSDDLHSEAMLDAEKYYTENPDKLGNDIFDNRSNFNYGTQDYFSNVEADKLMGRYDNIPSPMQLIGSGVESAGGMLASVGTAGLTGIPQVLSNLKTYPHAITKAASSVKNAVGSTNTGNIIGKAVNATPKIAEVAADGKISSAINKGIGMLNKVSVGKAVKFLNPLDNPTTALMGITSGQEKYNELRRMGYSKETSKNNALFTGYVNTVTEKMGYDGTDESLFIAGNKILTGDMSVSAKRNTANILKKYLSSNVSEGMEEVYATVFERMGDYFSKVGYVDDDGNIKQRKIVGNEGILDLNASRDSFLGGFVGGAVMGSAGVLSNIANTDTKAIKAHADIISKQTARMTEQMNNIAEKAGVDDISMPKPPTWSKATLDEINTYYAQTIDTFGKLLTDKRVMNNDSKAIENATNNITDGYLRRFFGNVSQNAKAEPKQALNGLSNLSKNISSQFNSVTYATPYADIFDANVKFLSSPDNVIDRDHISDYAKIFVDAIADNNSMAYNEISQITDDIPSALTDSVINNTVPDELKDNRFYSQTVNTFEKLLKSSLQSEYLIRNKIYSDNATLSEQMSEIINNGNFSTVNSVKSNNNDEISDENSNVGATEPQPYARRSGGRNVQPNSNNEPVEQTTEPQPYARRMSRQPEQNTLNDEQDFYPTPENAVVNDEQENTVKSTSAPKNTADTLSFRKVGDFYEMYGNDAVKFAQENGLKTENVSYSYGVQIPSVKLTDTDLVKLSNEKSYDISAHEYNGNSYVSLKPRVFAEVDNNSVQTPEDSTSNSNGIHITESEQRAINQLSQACNVNVEIVPSIQGGIANGVYKNGKIYIAEDAENKPLAVLSHEITHHFENTAPEAYELYRQAVIDIYTFSKERDINAVADEIVKKYSDMGINLSHSEAIQEIVADYTKNLLTDEAAINDFINKTENLNTTEKKSVLQNLHNAIVAVIDKIKSFLGKGYKSTDIDRMQKAADALSAMIAETERNSGGGNFEMATDVKKSSPDVQNNTEVDDTKNPPNENYIAEKGEIEAENGFKTKLGMEYTFESADKKYSMKENASNAAGNIYDYTKSFDEQLNDWLQGKIPQYDSLMIGATPDVFKKVGFNALPVTINQRHIGYALNGTKDANHALGIDMLKQLPKALEKPVAIFASQTQPNRVVAIVDMKHNGKSVVMPIEVDGYSRQNNIRIDSNAIVSVYAKDNAVTKQLNDAIQNEMKGNTSVFYLNKIKAAALLRRAELQLPSGPFLNSGYIHSIRENGSNVKPKFENVTYSQQFKKWFGDWEKKPNTASKVVNEDGTPKVVYHGTRADFNTFVLKSEAEFGRALGDGFYFTEDYKRAFRYANGITGKDHGGHIMSVYLDIKRPFYITEKNKMNYGAELEDGLFEGKYDGVIDTRNGTYLVFSSNQIKSATDNVGTFDSSNADIRYSLKESFDKNYDDWLKNGGNYRATLTVGRTSEVLQSIGIPDKKITWDTVKIDRIKKDHALNDTIIKQIPNVLENPVIIMKSLQKDSRIVLCGEVYDLNNKPVIAILELNPTNAKGNISLDEIKLVSAYGKDNLQSLINRSNILYVDKNKKRTDNWLTQNRLQLPLGQTNYRYNNNISHNNDIVNSYDMQNGEKNSIKSGVNGKTLTDLIDEYGSIEKGEKAVRDVQFPKRTSEKQYLSKFARTIAEAGATPDSAVSELEKSILDGKMSHIPITNKGAMQYAVHEINVKGFKGALDKWNALIQSEHQLTKNDIALGQQLYNQCINNKDVENAIKISIDLCAEETRSAQNVQAARMLKMLNADGQLYYIERAVQNINNEMDKKGVKNSGKTNSFFNQINKLSKIQSDKSKNFINGAQRNSLIHMFNNNNIGAAQKALLGLDSNNFSADDVAFIDFLARNYKKEIIKYDKINNNDFEKVTLNPTLAKKFLEAESKEARDTAYDELCQDIADQIPVTKLEKWNAWRYLSMLGNPRTHIRNITGNAVFYPVVRMKSYLAAAIEHAVLPVDQRTTSLYKTKESKEYAAKDFEIIQKELQGVNAKYAITDDIQSKRPVFRTKLLEFLRKKNGDLLELEDMLFLKKYYTDAFARFMTARNLTEKDFDISTEKGQRNLETARAIAFREAQEATYRDDNAVAEWLSHGQKSLQNNDSKVLRGLGYGVEALMPFKKTPLNIVRRGVEYSPAGLLSGIYDTVYSVKKGNVTAAEAVNKIAKGLTGTALTIIGFALANKGIATGAGDEKDKKRKFDTLIGKQSYSLNIGGKSYTIDWAAPDSLPFFVGVELYNAIQGEGWNFAKCVDALGKITEPMLELSCLQGISNAIESVQYNGTNTVQAFAEELTTSYITQALPTLAGQIARITDGTRRNAYYTYKDSSFPASLQRFIGGAMAKTPFVSRLLEPKIDSWGREEGYGQLPERVVENLVSPGYYSEEEYTAVDKELERLYKSTGEADVLPVKVSKKITYEKEDYNLNVHEYTDFSRLKGKKSFELIKNLINGKNSVKIRRNNRNVNVEYKDMTNEEKVKAISNLYKDAGDYAKEEIIKKYYPKKYKKPAATKK